MGRTSSLDHKETYGNQMIDKTLDFLAGIIVWIVLIAAIIALSPFFVLLSLVFLIEWAFTRVLMTYP
jgi:hypothetical protein